MEIVQAVLTAAASWQAVGGSCHAAVLRVPLRQSSRSQQPSMMVIKQIMLKYL
jgi:hypothetical protein